MYKFIHFLVIFILSVSTSYPSTSEAAFVNERRVYFRGEKIKLKFKAESGTVNFDIGGLLPKQTQIKNGTAFYTIDSQLLRSSNYDVRASLVREATIMKKLLFSL